MSPATTRSPGQIPTLKDDVVTLRELRSDDTEALVEHARHPDMVRWTRVPVPYARADATAYLSAMAENWRTGATNAFAVESQGRFAGNVDFRQCGAGLAEVGFSLMAWARGRGLMSRALRLGIPWVFDHAEVELLRWRAEVGNWPSRRVAWAVGFQVNGVIPGLLEHHGRRVDGWYGTLRRGDRLQPAHPWLDPVPIRGDLTALRAHRETDLPRIMQACLDPQTQHWLTRFPAEYTTENARAHLEQMRTDQAEARAVNWAVATSEDDRMLGEVTIFIRDPAGGQGEVGYWTHPDSRGRGTMTEAVRLAARHALLPLEEGGLGLNRLLLRTAKGNFGSQRVAQKNGFVRTGLDRRADLLRDGSLTDNLRFDLLADELPATR